jgi:hypothetical protein
MDGSIFTLYDVYSNLSFLPSRYIPMVIEVISRSLVRPNRKADVCKEELTFNYTAVM